MKIVILGAPGSGKDTAAKKIEKKFRLNQLVLGDYFKQEYKNKTKIGKAAYKYWSKGILCPYKLISSSNLFSILALSSSLFISIFFGTSR